MPLGSNLTTDITNALAAMGSLHDQAAALAAAYYSYTSGALFGASVPVITTTMRDAMASALQVGFTVPGLPATAAAAYGNAVNTFWTGVPVAGASGVGTVAGCPGASACIATLSALFAVLTNTQAAVGAAIATALQTATLLTTCTLTLAPNPPVVYPIS